jgi:hypothetical protein
MPPGIEVCFLRVTLELGEAAEPGDVIPLVLENEMGDPPLSNVLTNLDARSDHDVELMNGEVVVGEPAVKGVQGLTAAAVKADGEVVLRWRNSEKYDRLEVARNGSVLAELPGDATTVSDTIPGAGSFWYSVRGGRGGKLSPTALTVHTAMPGVVLFRRGDANSDGLFDVADGIYVCLYLFRDYAVGCEDAADTNDDGALDVADAIYVLACLFTRGPPPPPPGPRIRWLDPTPDPLGCAEATP